MKYPATVLLSFLTALCSAQNGYEIKLTLKPLKNQYVYLGHYYGKTLPIIDSVKLNEKSEGVFKGTQKLGGGIYLIGYPDRARNFEIVVDKNQKFTVIADTSHIESVSFLNSPENNEFKAYQQFMTKNGKQLDSLYKSRSERSPQDSIKINGQIEARNVAI